MKKSIIKFFSKKGNLVDTLVMVAAVIIVATTMVLNIYIGFYLLALCLLGLSVLITRYYKED